RPFSAHYPDQEFRQWRSNLAGQSDIRTKQAEVSGGNRFVQRFALSRECRSPARTGLGGTARFVGYFLCVFPLGRHFWSGRFLVQRRNSRLSILEDLEVFGLSGRQQDRLEKHSAFHVRNAARMALRHSSGIGSPVALARKIFS